MLGKIIRTIVCYCLFINLSYATDYYVDDASNTGDVWTPGAVGNNTNNGLTITTPKATIANVLSSYVLGAGDVIYVDAGTYTETGINIGTSDDGSGGSYMTIRGASNSLTIFNTTATANTFNFSTSSVQYIKVMDLKIDKSSSSFNSVNFSGNTLSYIWFENCVLTQAGNNEVVYGSNTSTANSNIMFNNCTITNTNSSSDADGIQLDDDFDNTTISNNTFNISGTSDGVFIYNTGATTDPNNISINNNTFNISHATSPSVRAVLMQGKTSSNIYSNTITMSSTSSSSISISLIDNGSTLLPYSSNIYSNTVTSYGCCINVAGYGAANVTTNISIYSNTLTVSSSSATHVGISLRYAGSSGNPISVYKNKIRSGYYGIYLVSDVQYCSIYNNYVSNAAYCFYSLGSTHDNTDIYFNSFYGSTNGGYIDELSTTHNIKNNIFHSTSASSNDYALEIITNSTLCASMNYNLYYVPNGARVGYFGSTSYTTFANWQAVDKVTGGSLGEENDQNGDPKFVNAASNDLDIHNASSKAYQLGTPAGSITTDIYGTTRNVSTPWIGAFENEVTLSVELLYFNANEYDKEVQLSWSTSTETNNDYFIIERSLDGKSFEEVTREKGAGNSTHKNDYFSIDFSPYKGISYYRLKQVDYDGKYTYSHIQSVDMEGLLSIYPNPSKDKFYIFGLSKTGNVKINVININGVELYNVNYFNNGISTIDLTSKPEGIYFVKIIDGQNEWLEKIVKVE
jgi:parallel beta-helix repeat protein